MLPCCWEVLDSWRDAIRLIFKKRMAKARGLAGKGAIELGEWSLTLGLTWCKREQTLMWVQWQKNWLSRWYAQVMVMFNETYPLAGGHRGHCCAFALWGYIGSQGWLFCCLCSPQIKFISFVESLFPTLFLMVVHACVHACPQILCGSERTTF